MQVCGHCVLSSQDATLATCAPTAASAHQVSDALDTFGEVFITEGEAETAVAGQAECLTRNESHLRVLEDNVGKLDRRVGDLNRAID